MMSALPLLFLLLAPEQAFAAAPAPPARPNVVLVTLDTVRADRMGFLGSRLGLTPNLDALARQSVVFERAYAQAPMTTVSHATLLTGTYPQFHGVDDFGVPLPAAVPYLPDLLRKAGYRTGAFVGSLVLEPQEGLASGFDRGFHVYDAGFRGKRGDEDRYQSVERRGAAVMARAVPWLDQRSPFFLWVHLFDAHAPYDPPPPFAGRYRASPYDGEIAYVDRTVGSLLEALRAKGLFEKTLIVVASDHGEGLGDHGEETHGVFLYDATIHVPLIVKMPAGRFAGRVEKSRVSLVDVAPTVLNALGLPVSSPMQGVSLLPLIQGSASPDRPSFSETTYPSRAFGWSGLTAWRSDRFLFVRAPRPELYDVVADPAAKSDLSQSRRDDLRRVALQEEAFRKRTTAPLSAGAGGDKPNQAVSELLSLGYVGGRTPSSGNADPKDKISIANAVHAAIAAVERGDSQKAAQLLQPIVAADPRNHLALTQLGIAQSRLGRYRDAIAALQTSVDLDPQALLAQYELGRVLFETNRFPEAAERFRVVVAGMPGWADARFALASALARTERKPEAVRELQAVLALDENHFQAHLLLGRLLTISGEPEAALPRLQRAVELEPQSAEARHFLADNYEQLGRGNDAQRERIRAQQLERKPAE